MVVKSHSKLFLRALAQALLLPFILSPFLFLPAGRLDWPMGWALMGAFVVGLFATTMLVVQRDPGLAQERFDAPASARSWDWVLTTAAKVFSIVIMLPVAGLNLRFGWPPPVALWLQIAGLLLFVAGYAIIGWAMLANTFFSSTVRIQEDRGHVTVSSGPYRLVRHPGYVGMILQFLAAPIALGSLWALIPGVAAACAYVIRTYMEDRTLRNELPGYKEYAERVRYRLVPGVW